MSQQQVKLWCEEANSMARWGTRRTILVSTFTGGVTAWVMAWNDKRSYAESEAEPGLALVGGLMGGAVIGVLVSLFGGYPHNCAEPPQLQQGLGMVPPEHWAVGESYQPYGEALVARQHMIKPLP